VSPRLNALKSASTREELTVRRERALLLGVVAAGERLDEEHVLDELASLADTAGAEVVLRVVQRRPAVGPTFYVGRGKAEELAQLVKAHDVECIVCDSDLSPAQIRNLERLVECKVVDRSELILDIFAAHARTREASLQVELAQLEYTYPRLTRMWSHLSRLESGMGAAGGIGTRGPGEQQLEADRRLVRRRVTELRRQIRDIEGRKARAVADRTDEFTICLVGYTNAGKSTLMNALTGAGVTVEDKLFSTLDTRTRAWDVGEHEHVLISDTVGFVKHIPHHLIASFRATLEEARQADLLLHVVDASHPEVTEQMDAVVGVLGELGCADTPTVTVFNKMDRLADGFAPAAEAELLILRRRFPHHVCLSAQRGDGLDDLRAAVRGRLEAGMVEAWLRFPAGDGRLLAYLARRGRVLSREYADAQVEVRLRIRKRHLDSARRHSAELEVVEVPPSAPR
jgi:GTP-binding protein HflX